MTHKPVNLILIMSLLIWAGACLGANMIAAPAKFQVIELTQPIALQVGRIQFQWVAYFEYILAILAGLAVLTASRRAKIFVAIALVLFIIQRVIILPQLSDRTDQIISGARTEGSPLHVYFIVCELFKIIATMVGAFAALTASSLKARSI
jgi:hypothetical protein